MATDPADKIKLCQHCGEIAEADSNYCTTCGSSNWGPVSRQPSGGLEHGLLSEASQTTVAEEFASLGTRTKAYLTETVGANVAGILIPFVPFGVFITNLIILYRQGQTVGARLFKIRVIRDNGDVAGFYQMFVRATASTLSVIPLGLSFWWAFRDENRQTWHDKMLGTYVVQDTPELSVRPRTSSNAAKLWFWILLVSLIALAVIIPLYTTR